MLVVTRVDNGSANCLLRREIATTLRRHHACRLSSGVVGSQEQLLASLTDRYTLACWLSADRRHAIPATPSALRSQQEGINASFCRQLSLYWWQQPLTYSLHGFNLRYLRSWQFAKASIHFHGWKVSEAYTHKTIYGNKHLYIFLNKLTSFHLTCFINTCTENLPIWVYKASTFEMLLSNVQSPAKINQQDCCLKCWQYLDVYFRCISMYGHIRLKTIGKRTFNTNLMINIPTHFS